MHKITPLDLLGINGYSSGLTSNSRFCWRWVKVRNGSDARVVTIEDEPSNFSSNDRGFSCVRTRDLSGCLGYCDDIGSTAFCWRWVDRDGVRYRVLTIEDGGELHTGVKSILPSDFAGKENSGYYDTLGGLSFNWRWLNRGNDSFRVVTIERSE